MASTGERNAAPSHTTIREKLIAVGERLFAEHGIEGVSLRQIGAAAGSANNVAVQYHFGDRRGLLDAIFQSRLPSLEVRGARLLSMVQEQGRLGNPRALLEVLLRPIAEERDESGRRSYAAFLVGLYHFEGSFARRRAVAHLAPVASLAGGMLYRALPAMPHPFFLHRMTVAADTFHRAVVDFDREIANGHEPPMREEDMLQDALDVACAILETPASDAVLARYETTSPPSGPDH